MREELRKKAIELKIELEKFLTKVLEFSEYSSKIDVYYDNLTNYYIVRIAFYTSELRIKNKKVWEEFVREFENEYRVIEIWEERGYEFKLDNITLKTIEDIENMPTFKILFEIYSKKEGNIDEKEKDLEKKIDETKKLIERYSLFFI